MSGQRVDLAALRPGATLTDAGGAEYLVVRRRWDRERDGLSIDLVRAGGPADPRDPWQPPDDEHDTPWRAEA